MSPQVLPPFPTGWFAIAYSADLKSGEVTTTTFCGQEVVVFRDSSGRPAVLDAYCPHLGAHLGHGGTVSDEGIRCPFHGWLWSPEGRCVDMPYGGRISPGAKTRSWPVTEQDDVILAWNGAEAPTWSMPSFADRTWTPARRMLRTTRSHPQEILENTVDLAHFRFVHGTHAMKVTAQLCQDGPIFEVLIESDPTAVAEAFRLGEDAIHLKGSAVCHGPGLTAGSIGLPGVFKGLQRLYATPIDGEQLELRGVVTLQVAEGLETGNEFVDVIAESVFEQWDNDIEVWDTKRYLPKPLVNRSESLIPVYRRWYEQFYQPVWDVDEPRQHLVEMA
jgi:3-ketosteroid 9alpha-monooxygenase subunit A